MVIGMHYIIKNNTIPIMKNPSHHTGYSYHIAPQGLRSHCDYWNQVIGQCSMLRLSERNDIAVTLMHPFSGEGSVFKDDRVHAEVFLQEEGEWGEAFYWDNGKIVITAIFEPGDELSPLWQVISWIAQKLDGKIIGSRGEEYDNLCGYIINDGKGAVYNFDLEPDLCEEEFLSVA